VKAGRRQAVRRSRFCFGQSNRRVFRQHKGEGLHAND
jgi:hypothetical protein